MLVQLWLISYSKTLDKYRTWGRSSWNWGVVLFYVLHLNLIWLWTKPHGIYDTLGGVTHFNINLHRLWHTGKSWQTQKSLFVLAQGVDSWRRVNSEQVWAHNKWLTVFSNSKTRILPAPDWTNTPLPAWALIDLCLGISNWPHMMNPI